MGARGKKSNAGIKAVATLRQRLPVPADLTQSQAAIWRDVVQSRPIDWFDGGSAPLLAAYCRAIASQRVLGRALEAFDAATLSTKEGAAAHGRLLAQQDSQVRLAMKLATAMRLSQHARRDPKTAEIAARTGASSSKLWERE